MSRKKVLSNVTRAGGDWSTVRQDASRQIMIIIDREAGGDNRIGSVRLSVCLFVCALLFEPLKSTQWSLDEIGGVDIKCHCFSYTKGRRRLISRMRSIGVLLYNEVGSMHYQGLGAEVILHTSYHSVPWHTRVPQKYGTSLHTIAHGGTYTI